MRPLRRTNSYRIVTGMSSPAQDMEQPKNLHARPVDMNNEWHRDCLREQRGTGWRGQGVKTGATVMA